MLLWSSQDTQKESNCVDMCYQKSVSIALVQCLTRKREERSKFWKAVIQYKSIQSSEQDSISCPTRVPVPKATTHVVSLLFSSSSYEEVLEMLCSTCTSPGICMIFFWHWTHCFFPFLSETLEWRSRKTFVITRNDYLSFCVSWIDHNKMYSFCQSPWCLLNWICGV